MSKNFVGLCPVFPGPAGDSRVEAYGQGPRGREPVRVRGFVCVMVRIFTLTHALLTTGDFVAHGKTESR